MYQKQHHFDKYFTFAGLAALFEANDSPHRQKRLAAHDM
jgi:hypothetical protein